MNLSVLTILFLMLFSTFSFAETPPISEQNVQSAEVGGTISGQVMIKAKTHMKNGVVLIFNKDMGPPPHPYKYWRIPDFINGTDMNGRFSVDLPQGTYYLMIAQKKADGEIGPPKEKEFLYFHGDTLDNAKPITVTAGSKINLGILTKTVIWTPKMVAGAKDVTSIEGKVENLEGKPVSKVVVFAYYSPDAVGRPAFVSDRTDINGVFKLRLYDGGIYYLKVRGVIGGGKPNPGEYQSATKEFEAVQVKVSKGERLSDIKLKVDRFSSRGGIPSDSSPRIWKNTGNLQVK